MMFEHFTPDARTVVVHAQEHARRLGHHHIGSEHLLLALALTDQPASSVLREHGLTPQRVEEEIVRQVGLGAGSLLFGTLNRDALASIGIDLDAVRARIEESFGPEALARAGRTVHRPPRPSRLNPRRAVPRATGAANAAPDAPSLRHPPPLRPASTRPTAPAPPDTSPSPRTPRRACPTRSTRRRPGTRPTSAPNTSPSASSP
ncbi:Clp protease N-terminal domain-containing protein [Streptomyces sp. RLB1-33]